MGKTIIDLDPKSSINLTDYLVVADPNDIEQGQAYKATVESFASTMLETDLNIKVGSLISQPEETSAGAATISVNETTGVATIFGSTTIYDELQEGYALKIGSYYFDIESKIPPSSLQLDRTGIEFTNSPFSYFKPALMVKTATGDVSTYDNAARFVKKGTLVTERLECTEIMNSQESDEVLINANIKAASISVGATPAINGEITAPTIKANVIKFGTAAYAEKIASPTGTTAMTINDDGSIIFNGLAQGLYRATGSQLIGDSTPVNMSLSVTPYYENNLTRPSVGTVQVSSKGIYTVTGFLCIGASAQPGMTNYTSAIVEIRKNGGTTLQTHYDLFYGLTPAPVTPTYEYKANLTWTGLLAAGDTIALRVTKYTYRDFPVDSSSLLGIVQVTAIP